MLLSMFQVSVPTLLGVSWQMNVGTVPYTILIVDLMVTVDGQQPRMSHEKNPYYFPLYWLVNTDPYNGLL